MNLPGRPERGGGQRAGMGRPACRLQREPLRPGQGRVPAAASEIELSSGAPFRLTLPEFCSGVNPEFVANQHFLVLGG